MSSNIRHYIGHVRSEERLLNATLPCLSMVLFRIYCLYIEVSSKMIYLNDLVHWFIVWPSISYWGQATEPPNPFNEFHKDSLGL